MIPLASKVNVNAPSTAYPFGNVRNNPGDSSGTPVDVNLVGDAMQFFEALMVSAGVTPNGQPESYTYGFQLIAALAAYIRAQVLAYYASTTQIGVSRFATHPEASAGVANNIGITPLTLGEVVTDAVSAETARAEAAEAAIGTGWQKVINAGIFLGTTGGGSVGQTGSNYINWVIIGKTVHITFNISVAISGTPTTINFTLPGGMKWATAFVGSNIIFVEGASGNIGSVNYGSGGTDVAMGVITGGGLSSSILNFEGSLTGQIV